MWNIKCLLIILFCVNINESARILVVIPSPSISHQLPFRPVTQELAKRGHDVVVMTTDPAFPKGKSPENLTEIDVHELSYSIWKEKFTAVVTPGQKLDSINQNETIYDSMLIIIEKQMETHEMKELLNEKFDLLILEAYASPLLGLSHVFKAPVIQMSSFLPVFGDVEKLGAPAHPILYPTAERQKINNITLWEKVIEMYNYFYIKCNIYASEGKMNELMKKIYKPDTPPLSELYNNVDMLFLNVYPIWDYNRPVPPGVVYLGGIHSLPHKELPTDLKSYLDGSKHGVIYISFGTNVDTSVLSLEKIQMFIGVFSRLPFDVLWKWNDDNLPGKSDNIRISKWFPQSDLLRHPKIKLFITQGGLQSTDEAISAGVPLIGIPMIGDQWYNAEQYVRHKIGIKLDMEEVTEDEFRNAIKTVIGDETYKTNMLKLRAIIWDQPQKPLDRAIWWIEHVLRHGGGRHLRAPGANMSWREYLELELLTYIFLSILLISFISVIVLYYVVKFIIRVVFGDVKLKQI